MSPNRHLRKTFSPLSHNAIRRLSGNSIGNSSQDSSKDDGFHIRTFTFSIAAPTDKDILERRRWTSRSELLGWAPDAPTFESRHTKSSRSDCPPCLRNRLTADDAVFWTLGIKKGKEAKLSTDIIGSIGKSVLGFPMHVRIHWCSRLLTVSQTVPFFGMQVFSCKNNYTWRIIPFSKWLVTLIYKPFRPFGRGTTLLRGLTNHGH